MTTFAEDEASVDGSEPTEFFEISLNDGVTVYRHTSGERDLFYSGQLYTALAMDRSEQAITMPGEERDMTLTLPVDHPLCQRWTQQGSPPMSVVATVRCIQRGGEVRQLWVGNVTSMAAEKSVAKFRVPSRAGEWMLRSVPSTQVSATCPHMLYGSMCRVAETGSSPDGKPFRLVTTVILIDGNDVAVNLSNVPATHAWRATWTENGQVYHPASGERASVRQQTDPAPGTGTTAVLTLSGPIVGLKVGDTVHVLAGCDWTIGMCHGKFGNRQNYGGMPQLPKENPFTPTGNGVRGDS